jgi:transcriptional regulator with GAF, ATPase, and Fis domain
VQVKLLRVLQEHEVQRLGSGRTRKIDVRLVAATNRDLHELASAGLFRMDLYHRLAGVVAKVPPLRQRIADVEILAPYFLERATRANQKSVTGISNAALRLLLSYSWPGNVRELQNVIERAVLLCDGALIAPEHLGDLSVTNSEETPLALSVRDEKARRIEEALEASGGNQAEAARRLGVAPSNLGRMIRRMGLKTPRSLQ